jgi:4-aminobutyrate aminotransferase-like enzyme
MLLYKFWVSKENLSELKFYF